MGSADLGRLRVNVAAGVAQPLLSGIALLLLYRIILVEIGAEMLGCWALMASLFGVARILDFGLPAAGLRLAAAAIAERRLADARRHTRLAMLGTALLTLPAVVILCALIHWALQAGTLAAPAIDQWSIAAIGIGAWLGFVLQSLKSSLDALQRVDVRHLLTTAQALTTLACGWVLIPGCGWSGLIIAYLAGFCVATVGAGAALWLLWPRTAPGDGAGGPVASYATVLKRSLAYGAPFQVTIIVAQLFDPLTRYLIGHWGSLGDVAWYEMANRLIAQLRAVFISAMESLVPYVAGSSGRESAAKVATVYAGAMRLAYYLGIPAFLALVTCAPLVSALLIGSFNQHFIAFLQMLGAALAVNLLSAPAHFCANGLGRQKWNIIAQVLITGLTVALPFLLGPPWGALGVVCGIAVAFAVGGVAQIIGFQREEGLRAQDGSAPRAIAFHLIIVAGIALDLAWWFVAAGDQALLMALGACYACVVAVAPAIDGGVRAVLLAILRRGRQAA